MLNAKRFLLAGVAIAMASGPQAFAAPHANQPILLAQAADQITEAVAQAQAKVDAARAALQKAQAAGSGVEEAQQALDAALKELNDARLAAGLPPATPEPPGGLPQPPQGGKVPAPGETKAPPKAEAPAAGEQKPAQPPAEETKQPSQPKEAPAAEQQKPAEQPPAEEAKQPPKPKEAPAAEAPKPAEQRPAEEAKQPPQPKEAPAAKEQQPAAEQPAKEATQPPQPKQAPAAGNQQPEAQQPAKQAKQPPQPKQAPAAANQQQPDAKQPAKEATQPPQPDQAPAAEANGQPPKFDPSMLKKPHPRFGEAPKGEGKVQLPKEDAQIPDGGQINAGAGRTIVKEKSGEVTVRHDDTDRFRRLGGNVDVKKGPNGQTTTTVTRPNGVQVVTIRDADGNILQRYRKDRNGQIEMLIGQNEGPRTLKRPPPPPKPMAPGTGFDLGAKLPPLKLNIPRNQYVVESSNASRKQLTQTFEAPPVEKIQRPYSLEEIRRSDRIRNMVRRVDFDTVTFEFGSAVLPDDQIPEMQKVGEAMKTVLDQDPNQVFLIEGHTDAVGSDLANLALSDRRAETVAEILTYYFGIPPENLVTQGYGEEFLKVPTSGPERANRRVVFRNITPLMQTGSR